MTDRSSSTGPPVAVLSDLDAPDGQRRNEAAIRLLDEWMADESGYDEET